MLLGDRVAYRVGERHFRVAVVVAPAEAQQPGPRVEQPAVQQRRQLVEIEVEQRQPVAELVRAAADRRWRIVPS